MQKTTVKHQIILTATLASLTMFFFCSVSSLSAKVFTFEGIAKPFITTTLSYSYNDHYRGIVQWTALPGQIVKAPIYDKNGNVIRPGDVLIQLDTAYRNNIIKTKENAIKIAEANLNRTKADFERYKTLSTTRAASLQTFQEAQNAYLSDLAALNSAKTDLISEQALFNITTYRAQFDAVVDKVLVPGGLLAHHPAIIQLSQIEPIAIDIKMPRKIARQITAAASIKVFPCNSNKPVGVITNTSILTDTGIRIFTDNWIIPAKRNKLPMVRQIGPVIRMSLSSKKPAELLSINEHAIKKDKKGTYVWYVTNAKNMQSSVPHILYLKKVYVETGDRIHRIDNHWVFIELKNPGKLKQYDLVVEDPPKGIKDGGKVYWTREKLLFTPDDPIRVEITLNS